MDDEGDRAEEVPRTEDLVSQYRKIGLAAVLAAALAARRKEPRPARDRRRSILDEAA